MSKEESFDDLFNQLKQSVVNEVKDIIGMLSNKQINQLKNILIDEIKRRNNNEQRNR